MAKNKWDLLMAQELAKQQKATKHLEQFTKKVVPEIYACFCKILYEDYGWEFETIKELFSRTENAWNENADRIDDMITEVEELTGIKLMSREEYDDAECN